MSQEFSIINFLIKSRLLFNTDTEYCKPLGMTVDSFRKRYEDKPSKDLEVYMNRFNNECLSQCGYPASYIYTAYRKASDVYVDSTFWGDWKHKSSKKNLCIWIFKKAYLKFTDIYENDHIGLSDQANEILEKFKPDLDDAVENIDIVLTMLFAFDILKPYSSSTRKFSNYDDISENMENLVELLKILSAELPPVGLHEDNVIINSHLENLRNDSELSGTMTPARLWKILDDIALSLRPQESPEELANTRITYDGYAMNGIWIDDYDMGENRFWIFPDNKLMAFRFTCKYNQWHLSPYEFAFYRLDYDDQFDELCSIITAKGNEQILSGGFTDDREVSRLNYKVHYDSDGDGGVDEINFTSPTDKFPDWMEWRGFKKLSKKSELYKKFDQVLGSIYGDSEMTSESIVHSARWLSDSFNCLIGMDNDFIYVSDFSKIVSFHLKRTDELDTWVYSPWNEAVYNELNLLTVPISEMSPLHILPRTREALTAIGKKINSPRELLKKYENVKDKNYTLDDFKRDERLKFVRFTECVCNTQFGDQITIYDVSRNPLGKVLCFNRYSQVFPISRLKEYGVLTITSRKEIINEITSLRP